MNNEIFEIENIIPVDYQNHIENLMTESKFPWYLNKNLVSPDAEFQEREDNHLGFNHFFYEDNVACSPHFNLLYPLVLSITSGSPVKFNRLIRMRANLTMQNKHSLLNHHLPHIDSYFPHWNAVYYVNDSDGDTVIFNETNDTYTSGQYDIDMISNGNFTVKQRITPKKGKIVIFKGRYYHASSFPRDSRYRCVININLECLQDLLLS